MSKSILLSSRSFMVWGCILRFLIHFVYFCIWFRKCYIVSLLMDTTSYITSARILCNIRGKEFGTYLLQFLRSKEGKLHSEQMPCRNYYTSSGLPASYAKRDG